jgi:hypothetical protein
MEENGSIPFLDVRITKRLDATLSQQVYRKPTHTEQYLHVDSHHHPAQKLGVIKTLATRDLKFPTRDISIKKENTSFRFSKTMVIMKNTLRLFFKKPTIVDKRIMKRIKKRVP